jgi:hypothetical protein
MPARTRSMIRLRSSSATAPMMTTIARPSGPAVSMFSLKLTYSMLSRLSSSSTSRKCLTDLASLSDRRFVQNEALKPQANNIQNTAASWLPADDYYTNFHEGDPFIKVDDGYARLPGEGYAALHPEVKDLDPEDYPDIHKMAILADVAPYSREYNTYRQRVGAQAHSTNDTELEIEYERILNRVKQTRESVIRMQDRHFTNPVEEIAGTVESASPGGVTLKEYPGRRFQFSSVSTSAADMSARIRGEQNNQVSSSLRTQKHLTRARQTEARSMIRPSHRHGSLILLRGAIGLVSPSLRARNTSRACARPRLKL